MYRYYECKTLGVFVGDAVQLLYQCQVVDRLWKLVEIANVGVARLVSYH